MSKRKYNELLGRVFSNWTVLDYHWSNNNIVICKCICGKEAEVAIKNLKSGGSKQCNDCKRKNYKKSSEDLLNMQFGAWLVIDKTRNKQNNVLWIIKCKCGNLGKRTTSDLKRGKNTGCYQCNIKTRSRKYRIIRGHNPDIPLKIENERLRNICYLRLKHKIISRDAYRCILCSKLKKKLVIHHIEKWSENIDKRFDEKNLITLCDECHLEVHDYNFCGELDYELTEKLNDYITLYYSVKYKGVA